MNTLDNLLVIEISSAHAHEYKEIIHYPKLIIKKPSENVGIDKLFCCRTWPTEQSSECFVC